jgi:GTPase involved in cell partitioning and DNA repair
LIDISPMTGRDPWEAYQEIRNELVAYDGLKEGEEGFEPLAPRSEIVALNKIDAVGEETLRETIGKFKSKGLEVFTLSAATGKNTKELVELLGKRVFQ